VNNTDKLDDIRRRLRVMEAHMRILQRVNVVMYERLTGRAYSVSDYDQKILDNAAGSMSDEEFWDHVSRQYGRRPKMPPCVT
jgi:hypothetical protein